MVSANTGRFGTSPVWTGPVARPRFTGTGGDVDDVHSDYRYSPADGAAHLSIVAVITKSLSQQGS